MWTFVNLTGIHFTVETDLLNDTLRRFGNAMQKFLSEEYEEGGLAVIEHTKSYVVLPLGVVLEGFDDHQIEGPATIIDFPPQLYIHGHALCYGGFKSKAGFEERWGLALVRAGLLAFEEFKKERENAFFVWQYLLSAIDVSVFPSQTTAFFGGPHRDWQQGVSYLAVVKIH